VAQARAAVEAAGVKFGGDTFDTGVCHMAFRESAPAAGRSIGLAYQCQKLLVFDF